MSSDRSDKEPIKVVDRRRLDEDGEERSEPDAQQGRSEPAGPPPQAKNSAPSDKSSEDEAGSGSAPPIDFAVFVQSLAQQALTHLGVLPHPETGGPQIEIGMAKQTIDILNILHDKTQGNLNDDEKQLLDAIVHDLRMVFVQVSSKG